MISREARSAPDGARETSDCHVYVVASKVIEGGWPKGDCFRCGKPLRDHEHRVSAMAPPGHGYVIDEDVLRWPA